MNVTAEPFLQRLTEERQELSTKLDKLGQFILSDAALKLTTHHFDLLTIQHTVMSSYLKVLDARLGDLAEHYSR